MYVLLTKNLNRENEQIAALNVITAYNLPPFWNNASLICISHLKSQHFPTSNSDKRYLVCVGPFIGLC